MTRMRNIANTAVRLYNTGQDQGVGSLSMLFQNLDFNMASIILKREREKTLLRRHPWIFSGAVAKVEGQPRPGETVDITTPDGRCLGRGAWSPHSQIAVRIWSFDPDEAITEDFFNRLLKQAIGLRKSLPELRRDTAWRLVNSESDGLPGLIVDRYGDFLVCQFLSTGAEHWKPVIVEQLNQLLNPAGIYERSDASVRLKEGLPEHTGLLSGAQPPEWIEIQEGPCRFLVDVRNGHKTGFYLDQRINRACVAGYAEGAEVLNCFAYTGAFSIAALNAGAAGITNIEASAASLDMARRHVELNGLDTARAEHVEGDVFTLLRRYRDSRRQFDVIILDPPKFAESIGQLKRASRGYKDVNLLAFKLLRPGGVLFTFSCSGHMNPELFQKIVADAALDAGRDARIIRWLSQGPDHPCALNFPEGSYLKGLVCAVS